MTTDAKIRALAVFDDYIELSETARARVRAELQKNDPQLLEALLSLVQADAGSSMLDLCPEVVLAQAQALEPPPPTQADPRIGTRLGAWQIDALLAEGGMGTVYAAHRADGQYEQRVALKCVRATLASPTLLQAFLVERNHLARLEHPGISTLLDGDVGEDGQPWFAMRFVDGSSIDAWCDHRNVGVRERVDLLIQVCAALSYAHAQGIVHGDIKPSNVLIDAQSRACLVDFGISSAIGAGEAAEPIAVTTDYAAPEVLEHGAHAPAADLYALGVLSYHLLCAQRPLPSRGLLDLIPEGTGAPVAMDALLAKTSDTIAHHRGVANLARLRRELAGDLSAIALKAVAVRPQDRYASVGEFAEDLRRWREGRPVAARLGTLVSRAALWVRRNRIVAGLAVAVVLALGLGMTAIALEHARVARAARATASVSQLFSSTLGTATLSGLGNAQFSSKTLLQKTERELYRLDLSEQPALHAQSLATLARSYATIGDYRYAERLGKQALRALGDEPDHGDFVAATHTNLLNQQGLYLEAMALARSKIQALDERGDEAALAARVTFGTELAQAYWGLGRTREALDKANDLVARAAILGPGYEELYSQVLILRADFLFRLARPIPAEADARRAIALIRLINPILADDALAKLARIVQLQGRTAEAMALAKELVRRRIETLGASHPKTAQARIRLSIFPQSGVSKSEVAQALASIRNAYGADNPQYAAAVTSAAWAIARDRQETLAQLRWAIAVLDRTLPANSEPRLSARYNLALVLLETQEGPITPDKTREGSITPRDENEGLNVLRETIASEHKAGLPADIERRLLVHYLLNQGDNASLPEAQTVLETLRAEIIALYGATSYRLHRLDFMRCKLLFRQGRHEEADRAFAGLIDAEQGLIEHDDAAKQPAFDDEQRSTNLVWALAYRGFHALETCRKADAVTFLERAVKFSVPAPSPPEVDPIVQAYLIGARKSQIPGIAPHVLPEIDRERINRAAQQCEHQVSRGHGTTSAH